MHLTWNYNLEKAPWWGGMFESMVRSMKMCLKKAIGGARLSYDELLTVTTQVEATLNSQPPTYVSSEDLEPIIPSHLLVGVRLLSLPECEGDKSDPDFSLTYTPMVITQRMKHMKLVMEHFWKRWLNKYLKELRDTHRYVKQPRGSGCIGVGDMVLVHDADHSPCTLEDWYSGEADNWTGWSYTRSSCPLQRAL